MKKLILSLLLFVGSIISFGFCENVFGLADVHNITVNFSNSYSPLIDFGNIGQKIVCIGGTFNSLGNVKVGFGEYSNQYIYEPYVIWHDRDGKYSCLVKGSNTPYLLIKGDESSDTFVGSYFYLDDLLQTDLPVMSSLDCQTNYSLIPISSVDQNYCVMNNLCPEIENGSGECLSGDVQWSALYINNIQHLGKPLINVTIPDYIFWDYSTDDEEFNLYVGSGYDQEYIDNVISINSYRPNSQDFTDVFVSGLTLVMPYIVIALFIIFVRKLIKRIFK